MGSYSPIDRLLSCTTKRRLDQGRRGLFGQSGYKLKSSLVAVCTSGLAIEPATRGLKI